MEPSRSRDDTTIRSDSGGSFSLGGPIDKSNLTLTIDAAGTTNVNGAITGDATGFDDDMIFSGGGTVNLNAANSYLGPTSIIGGTIVNANSRKRPAHGQRSHFPDHGWHRSGGIHPRYFRRKPSPWPRLRARATSRILLGGNTLTVGFGTAPNSNGTSGANFEGAISGVGTLIKDDASTQVLSGANTYVGLTNVNAGTLIIASDTALGSTASPGSVTNVGRCDATLALQNGITSGERITLFNNASLTNNSSTNTLSNLLLVEHDINGPSAGQKIAAIGALDGQLNLTGGIDDHAARFSSNPEMNLALNTGVNDDGTVHIDSVIDSSIRDITIGRATNNSNTSGTVILSGNNQHSGDTFLDGGPVRLGNDGNNSRAFGNSAVTVNNSNYLIGAATGPGAQLLNSINLNAGSTLNTQDSMGLGGNISGAGSLTVATGTLSLFGNSSNTWSGSTTVADGATLNTLNSDRISDSSALTVDGNLSLGGSETVLNLSGAATGTIENNGNNLTVNQTSDQGFSGNLTGSGGLAKQGEANLTLGNGSDFTGAANVQDGTLTISDALATNTINVANGATLTTTAADLLSDGATLTADGTVNLGGNETIANLLGADTGEVNLGEPTTSYSPAESTSRDASMELAAVSRRDRATLSSAAKTPSPANSPS